jgi:hypothetical protein
MDHTDKSPAGRVTSALAVMVLDPKIREWLRLHDPKALEQAIRALRGVDFPLPADLTPTS